MKIVFQFLEGTYVPQAVGMVMQVKLRIGGLKQLIRIFRDCMKQLGNSGHKNSEINGQKASPRPGVNVGTGAAKEEESGDEITFCRDTVPERPGFNVGESEDCNNVEDANRGNTAEVFTKGASINILLAFLFRELLRSTKNVLKEVTWPAKPKAVKRNAV